MQEKAEQEAKPADTGSPLKILGKIDLEPKPRQEKKKEKEKKEQKAEAKQGNQDPIWLPSQTPQTPAEKLSHLLSHSYHCLTHYYILCHPEKHSDEES